MPKTVATLFFFISLSGCGNSSLPGVGSQRSETEDSSTIEGRWIATKVGCDGLEDFLTQPEAQIAKDQVAVIGTLSEDAKGKCRRAIAYSKSTNSFNADKLQIDESGVLMVGNVRTRCVDSKGSLLDDRTVARPGNPLAYKLHLDKSRDSLELTIQGLLECPNLSLGLRRK